MKKILSIILSALIVTSTFGTITFAGVLPANTPVIIQSEKNISKNTVSVGDNIYFKVVKDVKNSNEEVIIAAGTPVSGKIVKIKERRRIGVPGEITINSLYTTSTNGEKIHITTEINKKAKSKMGLSITLSALLIPFFLLMRGKDAEIPAGYQTTVYTAQNVGS